jgi:hypothetical protein
VLRFSYDFADNIRQGEDSCFTLADLALFPHNDLVHLAGYILIRHPVPESLTSHYKNY